MNDSSKNLANVYLDSFSKVMPVLITTSVDYHSNTLEVEGEIDKIQRAILKYPYTKKIRLVHTPVVRANCLLEAIDQQRPPLIHFYEHRSKESVTLHTVEDEELNISKQELINLLNLATSSLKLVIFHNDITYLEASSIINAIPCCIAMNNLPTELSIPFLTTLYVSFYYENSIQASFDQALSSIIIPNFVEAPKLYYSENVNPYTFIVTKQ